MYIRTDVQVQPCSSQRRPCYLCFTGDSTLNVQKCKHLPRVCHDTSRSIGPYTARLQENHCSPGKLIKGEGKNVDLRVKNLAASQILSVDEMVVSG
jgi:hypothetical protein